MSMRDKACGLGDAGGFPEFEVIHRLHPIKPQSRCAALGRVETELVCLPGKALTWDVTRGLRFDIN